MLTSSFTGWSNYMMDFGQMLQDEEAMKRFGQTVVLWDFHARAPKKVFHVPGAPQEIRWAWGPNHNYAFTTTALTSQLWLIYEDEVGEWRAEAVADIGDPSKIPLPWRESRSSSRPARWRSASAESSRIRALSKGAPNRSDDVTVAPVEIAFPRKASAVSSLNRPTARPDPTTVAVPSASTVERRSGPYDLTCGDYEARSVAASSRR
jgi:hypothetical protein